MTTLFIAVFLLGSFVTLVTHVLSDTPRTRVKCPDCGLRNKLAPPPCAYCSRRNTFLRISHISVGGNHKDAIVLSVGCHHCQPITLYTARCKGCGSDLTSFASLLPQSRHEGQDLKPHIVTRPQAPDTAWQLEYGTPQPEEDISGIA